MRLKRLNWKGSTRPDRTGNLSEALSGVLLGLLFYVVALVVEVVPGWSAGLSISAAIGRVGPEWTRLLGSAWTGTDGCL